MQLVADANVLLSAVIGGRASLILRHADIEAVFTPVAAIDEVHKFLGPLARKRSLRLDTLLLTFAPCCCPSVVAPCCCRRRSPFALLFALLFALDKPFAGAIISAECNVPVVSGASSLARFINVGFSVETSTHAAVSSGLVLKREQRRESRRP